MNSIERNLPVKVLEFLENNNISEESVIVVGFSGGPDSTALLLSLNSIRKKMGIHIIAAYVNHGMRDRFQLEEDDAFVKRLAEKLDIELVIRVLPPGKISKISREQGRSSEEVARELRYDFFHSILDQHNDSYLLLGHNLDDQFETMIVRFFQGSGISGLKGIPHRNDRILRPLIGCRKDEILSYLHEIQQDFRIDPTNQENDFLRNNVRNNLIPAIETIFPSFERALLSQEKRFHEIDTYFKGQSEAVSMKFLSHDCSISINEYNKASHFVRLNLLYKMFDHSYRGVVKGFRVPEVFFNPLISGNLERNRIYAQAYGMRIQTDTKSLIFTSLESEESGFYYILDEPYNTIAGIYIVSAGGKETIEIEKESQSDLVFRSFFEGDTISISGREIQLKALFKKWNVLQSKKNLIPIIADSLGVIAVLGEIQGYKNIFRNKTANSAVKFNILYLGISKIIQE